MPKWSGQGPRLLLGLAAKCQNIARKAGNLEQVDDTGDGRVSKPFVDTLETAGAASTRASVRVKESSARS
jgi:hypothetical protein